MPQLFFRPKYVWFPVHLKGPMIPDPSGQLAELIVYFTSTRVDLYSHQILFFDLIIWCNHSDITLTEWGPPYPLMSSKIAFDECGSWLSFRLHFIDLNGWFNCLTYWPWEIGLKFQLCNFQTDFSDWWLRHLLQNCLNMNVTRLHWWSVSIGSGNCLVPPGNRSLPEPMLPRSLSLYGATMPEWVNWCYCISFTKYSA